MFTYNTMQTFIGVLGLEPLHMVAPVSDDPRRVDRFPEELAEMLVTITRRGVRPRDIVTPAALRNAMTVAMAMGGSTNVVLHGAEIARAAGHDLWNDVIKQDEFNDLSRRLPVVANMRPFGTYSMVDVDRIGGVEVIVRELLAAGLLDGTTLTCTGETLGEQVERLDPPRLTARSSTGCCLRSKPRVAFGSCAATSHRTGARFSNSPESSAASSTARSAAVRACSTVNGR
jgi:dihydroxy-acid dehydratase